MISIPLKIQIKHVIKNPSPIYKNLNQLNILLKNTSLNNNKKIHRENKFHNKDLHQLKPHA